MSLETLAAPARSGASEPHPERGGARAPEFLLALLSAAAGALLAIGAVPLVGASLEGAEPKAYWYLSRASGLVAFVLLWLSMALGIAISNKLARIWPGGPTAFDLHQQVGALSLAFGLFHAVILVGDRYVGYTPAQVLVPFASIYRPTWVGLGQVGLYLLATVALTTYLRARVGYRFWRLTHYLGYAVFLLVLAHGIAAGTDAATLWAGALYWVSGSGLLFLTVHRLLSSLIGRRRPARARGGA